MKKRSNRSIKLFSLSTLSLLSLALLGGNGNALQTKAGEKDKYYPNYSTLDQCMDAAKDLNIELAAEGDVLLKNDGTLPLRGNERISVFGSNNVALVGGGSYSKNTALTLPEASQSYLGAALPESGKQRLFWSDEQRFLHHKAGK